MGRHKKPRNNPSVIKLKLAFLVLLVITGFIMARLVKKPIDSLAKNTDLKQSAIKTPKMSDLKSIAQNLNFESAQRTVDQVKQQVLGWSDSLLQKNASQAGAKATDFIYEKAINPILDQVNKLPADQQQRLRKEICK